MKKLIAFFEIPATDFRRAVDFYETVLGVQLPTFELRQTIKDGLPYSRIVKETGLASILKNNR